MPRRDDETVSIETLVDALRERDGVDAPLGEIAATLHHVHLPKLETAGVLTYDHESNAIRPAPDLSMPDLSEGDFVTV